MERDDLGSRVKKFAANSIGLGVIAGLMAVTAYAGTTSSEDARNKPNTPEYFFEAGQLYGKADLTCTPGTKAYDPEQCRKYDQELSNFLNGKDPTLEIEDKSPKPNPEPADKKSTCLDCHNRYNQ